MIRVRVTASSATTDDVVRVFSADPAVSSIALYRGAAVRPPGDVVEAHIAREAANDIIEQLRDLDIPAEGTIEVEPVPAWLSRPGLDAEHHTPGSSADAVVWTDVTYRAYAESEPNWTYMSFMALATLLTSIAIILDSQILIIGGMVLGPEFGPIAALGVALVRRRYGLLRLATRTLVSGFALGIAFATLGNLLMRALGWVTLADISGPRPVTAFIYSPDKWSFVVAIIAAAAGVLSMTSERVGALTGVFISVTTIPAAGNIALGLAFGVWHEVFGSALQLTINLTGMALAGWATLAIQQSVWSRVSTHRARLMRNRRRNDSPLD